MNEGKNFTGDVFVDDAAGSSRGSSKKGGAEPCSCAHLESPKHLPSPPRCGSKDKANRNGERMLCRCNCTADADNIGASPFQGPTETGGSVWSPSRPKVEMSCISTTMNQRRMDSLYIDLAVRIGKMSHSTRANVGGVLVKDNNIISFGWNGTPNGFPNKCEGDDGKTLPIVVHAEQNIMSKIARNSGGAAGATMYLTLSPCFECAKLIMQGGVARVVYLEEYNNIEPIAFLRAAGVICELFLGKSFNPA